MRLLIQFRWFYALCISVSLLWAIPAQAKPSVEYSEYVIRPGDTLYDLASRFFIRQQSDVSAIMHINRIKDARRLRIGKTLILPRRYLKSIPLSAKVAAYRGSVMRWSRKGLVTKISVGDELSEGAIIETAPNAFVTLVIGGEVRSTIPSRSKLRIVTLRRYTIDGYVQRRFQLIKGRSEWDASPINNGDLQIRTPTATTAVRGTKFRVALDRNDRDSLVTVPEGTVEVSSTAEDELDTETSGPELPLQLPQGFGVSVSAAGISTPVPLLPKPSLEDSSTIQTSPKLHFRAESVPGASSYNFRIGNDAGLLDVIAENSSPMPETTFPSLPNGQYYVQVSAVDERGLEGHARTYNFYRILAHVDGLTTTADTNKTHFAWVDSDSGTATRFLLSTHPDLSHPIIDRSGITDSQFSVTGLKPGTYYWLVEKVIIGPQGVVVVRPSPSELIVSGP